MKGVSWVLLLLRLCVAFTAANGGYSKDVIQQLAAAHYPRHVLLQLNTAAASTTSSLATAVRAARRAPSAASDGVLVVFFSAGRPAGPPRLTVDRPLVLGAGQSLVLATAAALQAEAAQSAGQQPSSVSAEDMLLVECTTALNASAGSFIQARAFGSLQLLGVSIRNCPGAAITAAGGSQLLLANSELRGSNWRMQAATGAGVAAAEVQQVTLRQVFCAGNMAVLSGSCADVQGAQQLLLADSSFHYNWVNGSMDAMPLAKTRRYGGTVATFRVARVQVKRCQFQHNAVWYEGGAIRALLGGSIDVQQSVFVNNSAGSRGGAIAAFEVEALSVATSNFTGNGRVPQALQDYRGSPLTTRGGAVNAEAMKMSEMPFNVSIRGCRFVDNHASRVGGALQFQRWGVKAGSVQVHDGQFYHNSAGTEGGAFFLEEGSMQHVLLNNSVFVNNTAKYNGAAALWDADARVLGCTFHKNQASAFAGAIEVISSTSRQWAPRAVIANCTFTSNQANATAGALFVEGLPLEMDSCVFQDNKAPGEAGAMILQNAPTASLRHVLFARNAVNTSVGGAGALSVMAVKKLLMQDVAFEGNSGTTGGGASLSLVAAAALENIRCRNNTADQAGGAFAVFRSPAMAFRNSIFAGNTAMLGGALAADSSRLSFDGTDFTTNSAQASAVTTVLSLASHPYTAGQAGAVLLQTSAVNFTSCRLQGNTAAGDAGGVLMERPTEVMSLVGSHFQNNTSSRGPGGAVLVRNGASASSLNMAACTFSSNTAQLSSAGALMLDATMAPMIVAGSNCSFTSNTAAGDGAAIAAMGAVSLACSGCNARANSAAGSGGLLACRGCTSIDLTGGSCSDNTAAAAGGCISCAGSGAVALASQTFQRNSAAAGGAVAVQAAMGVAVSSCSFSGNTAAAAAAAGTAAAAVPQARSAEPLPERWRALYSAGTSAAAAAECSGGGSGGGVCVSGVHTTLSDVQLSGNQASSTGGAVQASAACSAAGPGQEPADSSSSTNSSFQQCSIQVAGFSASNNSAADAGGAIFTASPDALRLEGTQASGGDTGLQRELQQLAENNTAGGGSRSGVASIPTLLSLVRQPAAAAAGGWWQQNASGSSSIQSPPGQQQRLEGRKLLKLPEQLGGLMAGLSDMPAAGIKTTKIGAMEELHQLAQHGSQDRGAYLALACPALPATVLGPDTFEVNHQQVFDLPVHLLDAFGSQPNRGPGSDWQLALTMQPQQPGGSQAGQASLTGATIGALDGGIGTLAGLMILAAPGEDVQLLLQASPNQLQAQGQAITSRISAKVRFCLLGQSAQLSTHNSSSPAGPGAATHPSTAVVCQECASPSFSFSAYPGDGAQGLAAAGNGGSTCQPCPRNGLCVAGMVIAANQAYQVHPRSSAIHICPNVAACTRSVAAMQALQAFQCSTRGITDPSNVPAAAFLASQCQKGYAGPLCACAYRPGRQHPDVLPALQKLLATPADEAFGLSNRRCVKCQHIALVWLWFLLARLLDIAIVFGLALLWLTLGWLSECTLPAAAHSAIKQSPASSKLLGFGSMLRRNPSKSISLSIQSRASLPGSLTRSSQSRGVGRQLSGLGSASRLQRVQRLASNEWDSVGFAFADGSRHGSTDNLDPSRPGSAADLASPFEAAADDSFSRRGSDQQAAYRRQLGGWSTMKRSTVWAAEDVLPEESSRSFEMASHPSFVADAADVCMGFNAEQERALVLMAAVRYLAYVSQVVLDGAQIAAVLLSQDLLLLCPDWVAAGLTALITQAHTWQWVPFDCLLPASSPVSAAVLQTVLAVLLPGLYAAVLFPALKLLARKACASAAAADDASNGEPDPKPCGATVHALVTAPVATSVPSTPTASISRLQSDGRYAMSEQSSWGRQELSLAAGAAHDWWRPGPLQCSSAALLTATLVASMAYCFCFCFTNVVQAFSCMQLSPARARLPGEAVLPGSYWTADLQLQCFHGQHVAAVAFVLVIGLPALVAYLLLLLVLAWPEAAGTTALLDDILSPVQERDDASDASSQCGAPNLPTQGNLQAQLLKLRRREALAVQGPACPALAAAMQQLRQACRVWLAALVRLVATPVHAVQQRFLRPHDVSGVRCAALVVWDVKRSWWWLVVRELLKACVVLGAVACSMRAPQMQAMLSLMLVVLAAACSWHGMPGCCVTMERLQHATFCWLQLLAVLILLLFIPGIDYVQLGCVLLGLLLVVLALTAALAGPFVWRSIFAWRDVVSGSTAQ